ncbi:MAG: riboflavin synthase [bacterium]
MTRFIRKDPVEFQSQQYSPRHSELIKINQKNMFTGIIAKVGKIKDKKIKDNCLYLTIEKPKGWSIGLGASICTNGTCLTVKTMDDNNYTTELMPETLARTYFADSNQEYVNLEKSLSLNDLLDGHLVTGHVDTIGKIIDIEDLGDSKVYKYEFDEKYNKYVAEKASIAVDGISLTVVDVEKNWFTTALVDYTLQNTTIGKKEVGDPVHLEFDIIAKYLEKLINK